MKAISRDSWLAIGLFVVMGLITAVGVIQQIRNENVPPPLTSFSEQADGAQVLYRWLDDIGYTVTDEVRNDFEIPDNTDLVFTLEPSQPLTALEWDTIDDWVEEGGTFVLAGASFISVQAFAHYDVVLRYQEGEGVPTVDHPAITDPVVPALPNDAFNRYLDSSRTDLVPLVTLNGRPLILTFPQGEGRVILSSLIMPFSNFGIQQEGVPQLLLNLVGNSGGKIWFNEWHHGVRPASERSLNWLQGTPIGRSILYTIGLVFVWLVLRGRNFGRPVPLPKELNRRAPVEYITAVANLSRRAGHRTAVLRDTHDRLKRDLSFQYRLSPALPDDEFVEQLANFDPSIDKSALLTLLRRLSKTAVGEAELVQLMREAMEFEK